jgi:ribonuclease R
VHPKGFGFVDGPGRSARVDGRRLDGFLDGDRVKVWFTTPRPNTTVATRLELRQRTRSEVAGVVSQRGDRRVLVLDPGIGIGELPLSGPRQADGTLVRARLNADGSATTLERLDDPLSRFLVRHDFATTHSRAALDEARRLAAAPLGAIRSRRDLRNLLTFTIDADHSRDLDDAVSAEMSEDGCVRVWVHISDVTETVTPGSRLDADAQLAATSVYLPKMVRPMLPAELSEERLSLLPGAERDVLTVEMLIDAQGQLRAFDVYEARIRSACRLSYVTVARFLADRRVELADGVGDALGLLHVAASRLGFARLSRGGSAGVLFDETFDDGPDTEVAHVLIERLMVAANEAVGSFLVARGLPGVYRVHDALGRDELADLVERFRQSPTPVIVPDVCDSRSFGAVLEQFRLLSSFDAFRDLAAGALGSAYYSHRPTGHFALGSAAYSHFTSPIRRYADVVVHRIVKSFLRGERPRVKDLEALCAHVSERSRRSSFAERDARAFEALEQLAVGRKVEGFVLSANGAGVRVRVEGCPVVATVERRHLPAAGAEVGSRQRFLVSLVDPVTARLELRAAK